MGALKNAVVANLCCNLILYFLSYRSLNSIACIKYSSDAYGGTFSAVF